MWSEREIGRIEIESRKEPLKEESEKGRWTKGEMKG